MTMRKNITNPKIGFIKEIMVVFKDKNVENENYYNSYSYTEDYKQFDKYRFWVEGSFVFIRNAEDETVIAFPSDTIEQINISYWEQ